MHFHTFSVAAYTLELQAWGVVITSKAPAVGAVVPFAGINEDQANSAQHLVDGYHTV
jgi:uncharacterized Ntn-hydrolase superfamily protein